MLNEVPSRTTVCEKLWISVASICLQVHLKVPGNDVYPILCAATLGTRQREDVPVQRKLPTLGAAQNEWTLFTAISGPRIFERTVGEFPKDLTENRIGGGDVQQT